MVKSQIIYGLFIFSCENHNMHSWLQKFSLQHYTKSLTQKSYLGMRPLEN